MRRWFRSLHAQLFLWAVLPVTFAIVAIGFTGIYAHQQTMRDFVAERNLGLARLGARIVADGLAHGVVGPDGAGLSRAKPPQEQTADGQSKQQDRLDDAGEILEFSPPAGGGTRRTEVGVAKAQR